MGRLLLALRSLVSWTLGLAILTLAALIFVPLSLFLRPQQLFWVIRYTCRAILFVAGIRYRVRETAPLIGGPCIYMENHVNIFDHFILAAVVPDPIRGLEAEEHFRLPVYGWLIKRIGMMPVNRSGGDRARNAASVEAARQYVAAGGAFGIMPEGHRTTDGRLGRFHKGGFRLAAQTGAPVVPIVQKGAERISRKGDWQIRPGLVELEVLPAVYAEGNDEAAATALMEKVRGMFVAALEGVAPGQTRPTES